MRPSSNHVQMFLAFTKNGPGVIQCTGQPVFYMHVYPPLREIHPQWSGRALTTQGFVERRFRKVAFAAPFPQYEEWAGWFYSEPTYVTRTTDPDAPPQEMRRIHVYVEE